MDREKVIKAWECCNPFNRKCNECPYEKDCYHDGISRHMVADAIALLKEQETANLYKCPNCGTWVSAENVVRCKDCKYVCFCDSTAILPNIPVYVKCTLVGKVHKPDWFCADGVKKDE